MPNLTILASTRAKVLSCDVIRDCTSKALQGQWLRDFDNMKVLVRGYKAIFGDGLQMQTMKLQARPVSQLGQP